MLAIRLCGHGRGCGCGRRRGGRFLLFELGADFLVHCPVRPLVLLETILDLLAAGTEEAGASIATGVAAGSSCRLRDGWGIFRWGVISE